MLEVFQIKIQLLRSKPPIWRRFKITSTKSLAELHEICQIVMGWENSHMYQFVKNEESYQQRYPEMDFLDEEYLDVSKYQIRDLLTFEKDTLIYEYDFGDGWEHKLTLEKILPYDPKEKLPSCLKGVKNCPPEDCGGVWGYAHLLDIIKNPEDPEYKETKLWLGKKFDPELFDLAAVNKKLLKLFT